MGCQAAAGKRHMQERWRHHGLASFLNAMSALAAGFQHFKDLCYSSIKVSPQGIPVAAPAHAGLARPCRRAHHPSGQSACSSSWSLSCQPRLAVVPGCGTLG